MEENVMQQTNSNLMQTVEAVNEIIPAGATVTIDVPTEANGYTNITMGSLDYIPSNKSKAAAFGTGAAAAAAAVGAVIGIRFLIKKHKAKKAAAQQTTTTPQDEEEFIEV